MQDPDTCHLSGAAGDTPTTDTTSPMPGAAEGVMEARKRAAEAEDYARLRLDGILTEARAICAVVGLVPLSKLEGIVELVVKVKPRKKGKATTARTALNRGLPKGDGKP